MFVPQLTGSCKTRQKHDMLPNKQLCEPRAAPWKACQQPQAAGANVPPACGCTCSAKHSPAALVLRLGVTVLTAGRAALPARLQQVGQMCRHSWSRRKHR